MGTKVQLFFQNQFDKVFLHLLEINKDHKGLLMLSDLKKWSLQIEPTNNYI